MTAIGVDGCRGRWVAFALPAGELEVLPTLAALLTRFPGAAVVAVDVPLGLATTYPRPADGEARRFLRRRGGSVFPTPIGTALAASSHSEATALHRALTGKGITIQAFALAPRILEADALKDDERLIEVHPEVSFSELAGGPLEHSKRTRAGASERAALLEQVGIRIRGRVDHDRLDAAVAAWSAARYARGEALPLPAGHTERIGAIWR